MTTTPRTVDQTRYSMVAMGFHWLIAGLIIANVLLAWQAEDLQGAAKLPIMQWHKTLGISILVLSLARLVWRFVNKPPPLSPTLKPWERILAQTIHWAFYVAMIGIPLTGWIMVSATPLIKVYPIQMFGLFDWPAIGFLGDLPRDQMKATHEVFETVHKLAAKVMIYGLFPLHILGALKHQFIDKDAQFARMIPFLKEKT